MKEPFITRHSKVHPRFWRKQYSFGWRKASGQVAKQHEHVGHQRRYSWHKTPTELTQTYGLIAIEELNLACMIRNGNLSPTAHDAVLGMFRQLLSYKVENTGNRLAAVDPRHTSQACSGCGVIVAKGLNVRTHQFPDCGVEIDREVNVARNILARGLRVEAQTYPIADCVASDAPAL